VLASAALGRLPEVILIVVVYTLIQHIVAGIVNLLNCP
jgi:hypothetical protein